MELLTILFGHNPRVNNIKKEEYFSLIRKAIEFQQKIDIVYAGVGSLSITARRVTPKKIVGSGNNKKIVGFCHLRKEERRFNLDRILRLETENNEDER